MAAANFANFTISSSESTDPPSDSQYHVYIPSNYNPNTPNPLIFSIHGRTENMMQQERVSQLSNPAFNPSSIVICPQGVPKEGTNTSQWP